MSKPQQDLFNAATLSEKEWQGMPEFIQKRIEPYATIIVRCATEKDLEGFATAIGQRLTKKTKSIWFPFRSHWGNGRMRVRDES